MSESTGGKDPLDELKNNPEAIQLIKELYNVNDEIATELWHRFIETVKKMKNIAQARQPSQSSEGR